MLPSTSRIVSHTWNAPVHFPQLHAALSVDGSLRNTRVLVVGAGAVGCEVLKVKSSFLLSFFLSSFSFALWFPLVLFFVFCSYFVPNRSCNAPLLLSFLNLSVFWCFLSSNRPYNASVIGPRCAAVRAHHRHRSRQHRCVESVQAAPIPCGAWCCGCCCCCYG